MADVASFVSQAVWNAAFRLLGFARLFESMPPIKPVCITRTIDNPKSHLNTYPRWVKESFMPPPPDWRFIVIAFCIHRRPI